MVLQLSRPGFLRRTGSRHRPHVLALTSARIASPKMDCLRARAHDWTIPADRVMRVSADLIHVVMMLCRRAVLAEQRQHARLVVSFLADHEDGIWGGQH